MRRRGAGLLPGVVATLVLVLLFETFALAEPRNIRFSRLSLEDGLSQVSVNAILQDSRGFMWFGTQDGLNRFDGYRFQVFRHELDDPESLPSNWIWSLFEDEGGNLWVGTGGGLSRWNRDDGTLTHYLHDASDPDSLSDDNVRVLYGSPSGALWVGTDRGLNRYEPARDVFTRFVHVPDDPASLPGSSIRSIYETRDGTLWVGTYGGGLSRLDLQSGRVVTYRHDPDSPGSLADDGVRVVHEDRAGHLWIGTYEGGVDRFDPETETFHHVSATAAGDGAIGQRIRAICEDSEGTLWFGTDHGLVEWRPELERFVTYHNDPADPASLSDDRIMSIYQDRGGVVWVGTQGGGINRWNPLTENFVHYRRRPSSSPSLTSNAVTSLHEDPQGRLWVGTYDGLNRIDRERDTVEQYHHDPEREGSLSDSRVMSLLVDRRARLWVGTFAGGLNLMDEDGGGFVHFRHDDADPTSISADAITSIYETRDGVLWVGTFRGGLNRFDPATKGFVRYRHDPGDPASLPSDRVIALYEDDDGRLWIGTDGGGLSRFSGGRFRNYAHDPRGSGSLGSNVVFSILEDSRGGLWVGTQGGGLNHLERLGSGRPFFRRYGEREGLPNPTVYGILEDAKRHLWLSTNRGLVRFDPSSEDFKTYYATNGLQSDEFNMGAYHRSPSGELFFGGNKGFNAFFPDRVRDNRYVPPIVLTSFLKFNRPVSSSPFSEPEGLTLGYRDYVVSFEFSALDYTAPAKNRYAYMLEGFDKHWIDLGELHRVTFTNLDPGQYTLRVRGSNNDGVWNERGLSLGIHVSPPPWRSWWAYGIYLVLLVGVVWTYVEAQRRKLQREADYSRQLELEVEKRTRELAERNEELQDANSQLEKASVTDPLTGLRNRRFLLTNIEQDVALAERHYRRVDSSAWGSSGVRPDFLFLVFDLDGFKEVNDTHGHSAGDRVLIQVRDILQAVCRQSDTLIRWGGDEFLAVERNADRASTGGLAERIRRAIAEHPFDVGLEEPVRLTASIGFASYPFVPSQPALFKWEQVVALADGALYLAKKGGKNAWVGVSGTDEATRLSPESLVKSMKMNPERLVREGLIELKSSVTHPKQLVY